MCADETNMTDTEVGTDNGKLRRERDTLCRMIGSSQMFADSSSLHIEIMAHYAVIVNYSSGETVFKEGEKGQQMYLVADGSIEILKDSGGGQVSYYRESGTDDGGDVDIRRITLFSQRTRRRRLSVGVYQPCKF